MKPSGTIGFLLAFLCVAVAGVPEEEQAIKADYEKLLIVKYGEAEGNLDGFFRRFSKGVHMKLMKFFDEPSEDDLDIRAETVNLTYVDDEDKIPDIIVFEGNVHFTHSGGTVRAGKATVDMQTNEVLLTDKPVADWPPIQGWEAEYFRINLDTGELKGGPGKVREIDIRRKEPSPDADNPADPD